MTRPHHRPRLLAAAALALAVAAAGLALAGPDARSATPPRELLPDFDQVLPTRVGMVVDRSGGRPRIRMGFRSAVVNRGDGTLLIRGSRAATTDRMRADQVVTLSDGTTRTYEDVGTLRYTVSKGHEHWHLLRFDTYELRDARTHRRVRADRKTGFCLGDRYRAKLIVPAAPPAAVLTGDCGKGERGALSLEEGISPGYGDDYEAHLEGQYFDITGLRAGQYLLIHRVNAGRRLRERDRRSNVASVLVLIKWPNGYRDEPLYSILGRCPDSDRCRDN